MMSNMFACYLMLLLVVCSLVISTQAFTLLPVQMRSCATKLHLKDFRDEEEDESSESRYQEWRRKLQEVEQKVQLQIQVDEEQKQQEGFDLRSEMKRVESIAPGMPLGSPEQFVDDQVSKLEGELFHAAGKFDLARAQKLQNQISQLHIDDCGSVLQIHTAFYRAFSDKDYDAMHSIWLHDASVVCIHPSHPPLVGAPAVLESWRNMFVSTIGGFQRNWMEPTNVRLVVKGSTAIVVCDELVYARRFVRGQKRETELVNKLTATNVFRKVGGKWFMVHHHASWHADSEAAERALQPGGKPSSQNDNKKENGPAGAILGKDFGPYLGEGKKQQQGTVKKIIVGGSLSDILGGNLGDLLSSSSGDSDESAIIRITRNDVDDDADDDDDEYDEEDEDDDLEDDDDVEGGVSTFVKELHILRDQQSQKSVSKGSSSSRNKNKESNKQEKDSLRQGCIAALRKLCDRGSISQKQKRVLLTDIISCSSRGLSSMVEVAYELLYSTGDNQDDDVAEEEFADQCRVFSESLSEN